MFVYHKAKGIPSSSFTSKFDLFKLFLQGFPELYKVLFAPVVITMLYRCLPTRRGWKVKRGKRYMLLWTSKYSWIDCIIQTAVSTTFFKGIWKPSIGHNSIKNTNQHNLRLELGKHSKKLQSKCGGQNTSHLVTSDSHVYDLEAVLRELLNLGQWRCHKRYILYYNILPHVRTPFPSPSYHTYSVSSDQDSICMLTTPTNHPPHVPKSAKCHKPHPARAREPHVHTLAICKTHAQNQSTSNIPVHCECTAQSTYMNRSKLF